ncbi:MAG: hypothetical protein IKQ45_07470 [Clostridia bacterium]|nr:hypothetical protein [Clostridia bacterium]
MKSLKRWISTLCCIVLLPFGAFRAAAVGEEFKEPQRWTQELRNQSAEVRDDLVIDGKAVFTDGAELVMSAGNLYVTPEAVFTGNILIGGNDVTVDISGTITGNVTITSPNAWVNVQGAIRGMLLIDNFSASKGGDNGVQLNLMEGAVIDTVSLDGFGRMYGSGTIGVLDTSASNQIGCEMDHCTLGTFYARSDAQYVFACSKVGTTILDGLERTSEKHGDIANIYFTQGTSADHIDMRSGFIDIWDGVKADTIYMRKGTAMHIDCDFHPSTEEMNENLPHDVDPPEIRKLFIDGSGINCVARARIGYAYVKGGLLTNAGQIETLVLDSGVLENDYGDTYEDPNHYHNIFGNCFEYHVGTLIAGSSRISANQGSVIRRAFLDNCSLMPFDGISETIVIAGNGTRGTVGSNAVVGNLASAGQHSINYHSAEIGKQAVQSSPADSELARNAVPVRGGSSEASAVTLDSGVYLVDGECGSTYFSIPCDAYSSLQLAFGASGSYGCALVRMPDATYRLLDPSNGENACSLFTEVGGNCLIRLAGTSDTAKYILQADLQEPVHIDLDVTAYTAHDDADEMIPGKCDLAETAVSLFNTTQNQAMEAVAVSDEGLYCLPGLAQPGDEIQIRASSGKDTIRDGVVTVKLDEKLYASASIELREKGRYRAVPADDTRARLYLYDRDGSFLKEIHPSAGGYDTGGMDEGIYYAVWIRGSIGAWKLLHLADYSENALENGTHYLLEELNITDGTILHAKPDIPAEPQLQSPYLLAAGTAYEARKSAVVQGDMALFSLEWALTEACEGAEAVEIVFLSGAEYVRGSAVLDSGAAENVAWDNNVLSVPVTAGTGKLLFYMEAAGEPAALVSNASIRIKTGGEIKSQYIGSAQVKVSRFSISGPSLTSGSEVLMTGYAAPYSQLDILDFSRRVTSAIAGARGQWSALVPLSSAKTHSVAAQTEDGLLTAPVTVTRAAGAPRLKQFVLDYNEHGEDKQVIVSGDAFGKSEIRFAYLPGSDLTFTLTLENDALLKEVTLVALMDGVRFELPAESAGDGRWIAHGQFSSDDMFAPDRYTIEYTFREDALREAFREPCIEVPLMHTLVSADDLSSLLPLTRYYMASPTLQTVDRGFGPGWLTNYDIYAIPGDEAGSGQWVVWSPDRTRIFTPNGNTFTEEGGFAKASVSSDGFTIEEQDGSRMGFGTDGRLAYIADSSGFTILLTYDDAGRLLSVGTPDVALALAYDSDGRITSSSCGDETVAYAYERDALIRAENAEKTDTYVYEGLFTQEGLHPLTAAVQSGESIRFRYNSRGFPSWIETNGVQAWLEYGENTVTVTGDNNCSVTYTLNGTGSISRMDTSDGSSAEIIPMPDGTTRIISMAQGRTAESTLDGYGRIISQTDTDGFTVHFSYDVLGYLSAVTDKAGRTTRYESNDDGQTAGITYPDGTSRRYGYDGDGNLTQFTGQSGETTCLDYQDGALVRVRWPDSTQTDYEYSWDENSASAVFRRGEQWNRICVDESGYDYTLTDSAVVHLAESEGNRYAMTFNGQGTESVLKENGNLSDVYGWDEDVHLLHVDYEDGLPVREVLGNGVTAVYTWNEDSKVSRTENLAPDGSLLSFFELEFNDRGNIIRRTSAEGTWFFSYDEIGQLTRAEGADGIITYTYDQAGNRLSKTVNGKVTEYSYDQMNRLLSANGVSYEYDLQGRLVKTQGEEGTTLYTWNALNQLVSVSRSGQATEYTYDLFGNRSSMTINGKTRSFYNLPSDISQTLAMEDSDGMTVFYVGSSGLICAEHEGKKYYYTYTPLGSVSEITDEQGNIAARYTYDPEGHVTGKEVFQEDLFDNPFTYAGRYGVIDDSNGLWCARARFVDQDVLRFISPDPAEQVYDLNLYRYAGNNPVENVDITGESIVPIGKIGSGFTYIKNSAKAADNKIASESAQKISQQLVEAKNAESVAETIGIDEMIKRKDAFDAFQEAAANYNKAAIELNLKKNLNRQIMPGITERTGNIVVNKRMPGGQLNLKGFVLPEVLVTLPILGTVGFATAQVFADPNVQEAFRKLMDFGGIFLDVAPIVLPILLKALAKAGFGTVTASTGVGTAVTVVMWASTAKDLYDIATLIKEVIEARQQNEESGKQVLASSPAETKIDPSGYVYEAVESNRLDGVTATVFYRDDDGYPVFWNAAEYDEENPQITDQLGQYGWDVPSGHWRVRYEKEGFETVETSWLPVPPPQTEVNIGIVCLQAPEIISVILHGDSLELEFSRYMIPASVQGAILVNGTPAEVQPLDAEPAADNPEQLLASVFLVSGIADPGSVILTLTDQAVSYAGIPAVPDEISSDSPLYASR